MFGSKDKKLSEQEIIEGCMAGKQRHQAALYEKYSSKMFAVCLRYASDYHTAEDILQDGFIKVFSSITKYRNEGSLEGWVRRIIVNTAIEQYRKNIAMYPISDDHTDDPCYVDDKTAQSIDAADMMQIVQDLAPGYRTIFNLYAIEGYNHKEIGEMLNISEGTSKSQLARARYLLQQKIEQYKLAEEYHG